MASAVITITAGNNAGATLRRLGQLIQQAALPLADTNPTGASVTLTVNDAPGGSNVASIVVAGAGLPTQTTYAL